MFSRFTKLFKKSDLDEQRAFQAKVLLALTDLYPEKSFVLADDPLTIDTDSGTLGLTNIRSNFLFGPQTDLHLRELVHEHFQKAFLAAESWGFELDWNSVRQLLMPQLMPRTFLEKMDLVYFPFGDEIVVGIVIDKPETYSYVLNSKITDWNIEKDELRKAAIQNLSNRSRGIEMTTVPGDNAMFIVQTMDGFDAVRIIEPEMRSFIAEYIGSPFYFGVPNRDFLICWSKNRDKTFQDQMCAQISNDFDEQPYPLGRFAFEVGLDGEIRLADFGESDRRAVGAKNN